jgi:predicted dehydrogenase/threonine dehydrogenase-like Zn-dependent dehydrogenase
MPLMKQLLQNLRTGETEVVEVPIPTPQRGEVLVKTVASLVSAGTERTLVDFAEKNLLSKARSRPDLVRQVMEKAQRDGLLTTIEAAFNRLDQPMPLGYSSAGIVSGLGPGVQGFQVGQRVACGGGNYAVHAEYACVPKNLVTILPDQVNFDSAAFTTLGAIAMHGFRLAEIQLGESVAVIGLGLLGQLSVGIAAAAGCHVLGIDLDEGRVALARQMGASAYLRAQAEEAALSFTRGRGCDAVLICADSPSSDPVELAGAIARDRARVIAIGAVGLNIPRKLYFAKELTFLNSRSYGPGRYDPSYEEKGQDYPIGYVRWTEGRNMEAFVDLLANGRLDPRPLITHRFPIEQAPDAYQLITGKTSQPFLGVLLTYPSHDENELPREKPQLSATTTVKSEAKPPADDQVCRLGVLGAGSFANAVMLPAVKAATGIELIGIASASGMSAQHAARRFGFCYASSNEAEIINDPQVNTVAVLTRHDLHAGQVVAALAAGKHVFCEKPLAMTETELQEIEAALANSAGGQSQAGQGNWPIPPLLTVGFNRRFAPMAQRLRSFLGERQEPFMALYRVNAGYLPTNHWLHDLQIGGGRIVGEGCHFVDLLTFLAGETPISVAAFAQPDAGHYREDNVIMNFTFPDGSTGTIAYLANGDKAFSKERLEVFCAGRVGVLDDYRTLSLIQDGRKQVFHSRLRQDKGHRAEWQAFASAISTGAAAPIPYQHLFGVTRATFAAVKAIRTGERVSIG